MSWETKTKTPPIKMISFDHRKIAKMQIVIPILIMGWFIVGEASGFTHIVGGKHGWRVPEDLSYYQNWAKPRTFGIGDRLVFPSRPMGNNVVMVSKEDFQNCTQNKVLAMYYEGPLILTLNHTGEYFYYSGVGKHCERGQKLQISVGDKEGSSGDPTPFKFFSAGDYATAGAGAPPPLPDAGKRSSATTSLNIGRSAFVGLLLLMFSSQFLLLI